VPLWLWVALGVVLLAAVLVVVAMLAYPQDNSF
jgi:hypothetical protein